MKFNMKVRIYRSIRQIEGLAKTKYPINLILIFLIFFKVNSGALSSQIYEGHRGLFLRIVSKLILMTHWEYKRLQACLKLTKLELR